MSNLIKTKHFVHVEGSGKSERAFHGEVTEWINSEDVDVIQMDHSYTRTPYPTLSIFATYKDIVVAKKLAEKAEKAAKKAVDHHKKQLEKEAEKVVGGSNNTKKKAKKTKGKK